MGLPPRLHGLASCAMGLAVVLPGCASLAPQSCLTKLLRCTDLSEADQEWIAANVPQSNKDALITVVTDPEWDQLTVRFRYVWDGSVVCRQFCRTGLQRTSEQWYKLGDEGACEVFHNLYSQAAAGFTFRSTARTSNPSTAYVLTLGRACAVTIDRGGDFEPFVCTACRLRADGYEPGSDPSAAATTLWPDLLPSFATYVVMAVLFFDDVCRASSDALDHTDDNKSVPGAVTNRTAAGP